MKSMGSMVGRLTLNGQPVAGWCGGGGFFGWIRNNRIAIANKFKSPKSDCVHWRVTSFVGLDESRLAILLVCSCFLKFFPRFLRSGLSFN